MEGSFAKELYSESLEPNPPLNVTGEEEADVWGDSDEELGLDREWEKRRNQFHTIGYRDGLIAGKEASAQEGFNTGFKQSAVIGFNWGLARGVTSAFACLPDGLKEKLVDSQEKRDKFQALYESVHSLSTSQALKLFHEQKTAQQQSETSSSTSNSQNSISNCSLGNYVEELHSLLLQCPAIVSHLSAK